MAILLDGMASPSIKATYSLDPETVRLLERTAKRWSVSKSEALRRAIRAAAAGAPPEEGEAVLDRLQEAANVSEAAARTWVKHARTERRAAGSKRARRD
jgi:hypothetical protein